MTNVSSAIREVKTTGYTWAYMPTNLVVTAWPW